VNRNAAHGEVPPVEAKIVLLSDSVVKRRQGLEDARHAYVN
jgi:hypothetical protein